MAVTVWPELSLLMPMNRQQMAEVLKEVVVNEFRDVGPIVGGHRDHITAVGIHPRPSQLPLLSFQIDVLALSDLIRFGVVARKQGVQTAAARGIQALAQLAQNGFQDIRITLGVLVRQIDRCAQVLRAGATRLAEDQGGDGFERLGLAFEQLLCAAPARFSGVGMAEAAGEESQLLRMAVVARYGSIDLRDEVPLCLHAAPSRWGN